MPCANVRLQHCVFVHHRTNFEFQMFSANPMEDAKTWQVPWRTYHVASMQEAKPLLFANGTADVVLHMVTSPFRFNVQETDPDAPTYRHLVQEDEVQPDWQFARETKHGVRSEFSKHSACVPVAIAMLVLPATVGDTPTLSIAARSALKHTSRHDFPNYPPSWFASSSPSSPSGSSSPSPSPSTQPFAVVFAPANDALLTHFEHLSSANRPCAATSDLDPMSTLNQNHEPHAPHMSWFLPVWEMLDAARHIHLFNASSTWGILRHHVRREQCLMGWYRKEVDIMAECKDRKNHWPRFMDLLADNGANDDGAAWPTCRELATILPRETVMSEEWSLLDLPPLSAPGADSHHDNDEEMRDVHMLANEQGQHVQDLEEQEAEKHQRERLLREILLFPAAILQLYRATQAQPLRVQVKIRSKTKSAPIAAVHAGDRWARPARPPTRPDTIPMSWWRGEQGTTTTATLANSASSSSSPSSPPSASSASSAATIATTSTATSNGKPSLFERLRQQHARAKSARVAMEIDAGADRGTDRADETDLSGGETDSPGVGW